MADGTALFASASTLKLPTTPPAAELRIGRFRVRRLGANQIELETAGDRRVFSEVHASEALEWLLSNRP